MLNLHSEWRFLCSEWCLYSEWTKFCDEENGKNQQKHMSVFSLQRRSSLNVDLSILNWETVWREKYKEKNKWRKHGKNENVSEKNDWRNLHSKPRKSETRFLHTKWRKLFGRQLWCFSCKQNGESASENNPMEKSPFRMEVSPLWMVNCSGKTQ